MIAKVTGNAVPIKNFIGNSHVDAVYTESDSKIGRYQGGAPILSQEQPASKQINSKSLSMQTDLKSGGCPTPTETDASGCFGIKQKVIDVARGGFWKNFSSVKGEVDGLSAEELKNLLAELSKEKDSKKILDGLSQILSLEKVEEAVEGKGADAIQEMAKEAASYLNKIKKRTPSFSAKMHAFIDTAQNVLESFLNAFGINEFFKPAESKSDAKVKAQTMMMLLQFALLLSTLALPILGPGTAGAAVGLTILSIWTLSLIYPYFRRMPATLLFAENWSYQYRMGQLKSGPGRKGTIDEIAQTLMANNAVKTHPLLLGESGVGKTETAKSLVAAIERGEYPALTGKQVFYINTAELIGKEDATRTLGRISETLGRHRKNIILIFDEIHIACQKRESLVLAEQLKTLLDNGPENFPYVVGITTKKEFDRFVYTNNPAFARRFKRIFVEPTNLYETVQVLKDAHLQMAPTILIESKALETLAAKTEGSQPAAALKVLALCLSKTTEMQKSSLQQEVEELRAQIDLLYLDQRLHKEEIYTQETRLKELEVLLNQEREDLRRFYEERDLLASLRKAMYEAVIQSDGKKALLYQNILIPAKEEQIKQEAKRLGLNTLIDSAFIDSVIEEERQHLQKTQSSS
jgi:ATP-dependent Clp protease ATP-binding subunit ClpA